MADIVERLRDYGLTLDENVIFCDRRVVDEAADMLARLLAGNSSSLSEARATGRREGLSEAAAIAEEQITYTFHDGSPAVTRPRPDGATIAAAIRAAMEKAE